MPSVAYRVNRPRKERLNALGEKQFGTYGEHTKGQHYASDNWDNASQELKSTVRAFNKANRKAERIKLNKKRNVEKLKQVDSRINATRNVMKRLGKTEGIKPKMNLRRDRMEM